MEAADGTAKAKGVAAVQLRRLGGKVGEGAVVVVVVVVVRSWPHRPLHRHPRHLLQGPLLPQMQPLQRQEVMVTRETAPGKGRRRVGRASPRRLERMRLGRAAARLPL